MEDAPLFSAEIKIVSDPVEGLHFESSEKYSEPIRAHLEANGIRCADPSLLIQGTRNIHSFVSVAVSGKDFSKLESSIKEFIIANRLRFTEERQNLVGEITVTLYLLDVSVYDK